MFIALTGGIGCGKSRALAEFAQCGFQCFDADKICHEFYFCETGKKQVAQRFPAAYNADTHEIDRRKLGDIVFRDERELAALEAMIAPFLRERMADLRKLSAPVMVEVPLLYERDMAGEFDGVVSIWSPFEVRRMRLMARGWDYAECARRERLQFTPEAKLAKCDWAIINSGSEELLQMQCRLISNKILALFQI